VVPSSAGGGKVTLDAGTVVSQVKLDVTMLKAPLFPDESMGRTVIV